MNETEQLQQKDGRGKTSRTRVIFKWSGATLLGLVLLLLTLWALAALYIDVRWSWLRLPLVCSYVVVLTLAWFRIRRKWIAAGVTLGGFILVLLWWLTLKPYNNRPWEPDLAAEPYAEIAGSEITIHNVRNCDYRTEMDYDVHYYDKTFDLEKLEAVDLYLVYWGSPNIAHTMVSFGFKGDSHICFSIETRKEKGEGYSALKGFFRQFELFYVAADERDLVRLRTNYRQGEEVYLFRTTMTQQQGRDLFKNYVRRMNELHERPEWYNAATENCTTAIRAQRAARDRIPWDWRMLVNGHLDELLYEQGAIHTNLPLAEMKQRCHINEAAKAADKSPDFSSLIRQNVP